MGERKIVSVKLEQGCWEVSVKQSDLTNLADFGLGCPTLAMWLLEVETSSQGKQLTTSHLENCRKKILFKKWWFRTLPLLAKNIC